MGLKTNNTTYWLAWTFSRGVLEAFYRTDVYGTYHIPKNDSFILAGNHASFFDPPAFGCSLPRELAYFARKTLFKPGFPDRLLRQLNSIPVDRDGDSDVGAFKQVFKTLKGERGITLFPEGTRTHDGKLQPAKKGVGLIACKTQVPVVPARIFGTFDAYGRRMKTPSLKPCIHIVFGAPLPPEEYDPGKDDPERYQVAADRIMSKIHQLQIPQDIGWV